MKFTVLQRDEAGQDWDIFVARHGRVLTIRGTHTRVEIASASKISAICNAIDCISKALEAAQQAIERCPFCGAEARVVEKFYAGDPADQRYRVECLGGLPGCGGGEESHALDRWANTPSEAIIAWNKRIR